LPRQQPEKDQPVIRHFENVLTSEQLQRINELLEKADFVDGVSTAGVSARRVKNNLQAKSAQPELEQAKEIFGKAVLQNKAIREFAMPQHVMPPIFSRYETGMRYGEHIDNSIMGGIRTDLAMTLFLSPPESYDGGELVIEVDREARPIKLAAGSAVVYSASSIHRVETVTRGRRQVAVTWIQSMFRDEAKREIIIDLNASINRLRADSPDAPETLLVAKVRSNLYRMWADT
jgi:PKHD-type hydroxylase